MAFFKPEISIPLLPDDIETEFQRINLHGRRRFTDVACESRNEEYDAKLGLTVITWKHLQEAKWSCSACKKCTSGARFRSY